MKYIYALRKQLERVPLQCPVCGETSDSIKSYSLPDVTFMFVAYSWGYEHHVACAKCMRRAILVTGFDGLLSANVVWPIFYLPRLSVHLVRTFVKGHSEDIINDLHMKLLEEDGTDTNQ